MDRTDHRASVGNPHRILRSIWAYGWLPLLLGGLAVILEPRVDDFMLAVFLLVLAHTTTWLPELVRRIRRPSHGP